MSTSVDPVGSEQPPLRCANCRITLRGAPVEVDARAYCCEGCADGGPCGC